jgi:hypothetical protein
VPFALLIIGLFLLASAIQGTQNFALKLIVGDFTGPNNFFYWVVALLIIGSIGYIDRLKPVSDGLLALVILVLILATGNPQKMASGGFFRQFTAALQSTGAGASQTSAPQSIPPVTKV